MSWAETFKDAIGWETPGKSQAQNIGDLLDADAGQNRITMIGTMGAGKSAFLAKLLIAADRKVSKSEGTEYPFRYLVDEKSANIEHDKSALRAGHFPPKTGMMKASNLEPGLTFEWSHTAQLAGKTITLTRKLAKMPICDLAGEDLVQLIEKVSQVRNLQQAQQLDAQRVTGIITQSAGIMLIIKATRAQGLGIELEKEPIGIDGMSIYSDANLKRMIDGIIRYKRMNRSSPPIRGVAIVVTAWDGLDPVAKQISAITGTKFDPTDTKISQDSLRKFVYACYPSTYAAIVSLGIKNIVYFPSFFNLEKDSKGEPVCWEGTESPKIKRLDLFDPSRSWEDSANTISASEFWDFKVLDWLQQFAESG